MIDGKNFFDQPLKNNRVTYENIRKIATGQGDDTTDCLLDYIYFSLRLFKRNCKNFVNKTLLNNLIFLCIK